VFGPVVGAFVIARWSTTCPSSAHGSHHPGIIFVVCVLAFRRGIIGELEAWLRGRRKGG
jgi:branched-chain amino acid transport system permease protein